MMLSKDERFKYKHTLDLRNWGFTKVSDFEYRHANFFCVSLGDLFAVFSSKRFTRAVEYDKVEQFLADEGFTKQEMSSQEKPGSGEDEK